MKRRSLLAAIFAAPMLPIAAFAKDTPPSRLRANVTAGKNGYAMSARAPFVLEDGIAKLSVAGIGEVTAGSILVSADGGASGSIMNSTGITLF